MAGIYFHIPFCKTRCNYCDFFSSKDSTYLNELIKCEVVELESNKDFFKNEPIETIYFGGGTPSYINKLYIEKLLNSVNKNFKIIDSPEITLEANPDDITNDKILFYKSIGINRISLGVQSFSNEYLKFLNRRHTSQQAIDSINIIKSHDLHNINIDLIYGLPGLALKEWVNTLKTAMGLNLPHLSAYHLSYEKGTKIYSLLKKNKINQITDEESFEQYALLCDLLSHNKYKHYEISNFAKENYFSKHNSSYWNNKKYLGIGPSAHSYNEIERRWNIANTQKYILNINSKTKYFSKEKLNQQKKYNDYIITHLRTSNGINEIEIESLFSENVLNNFKKTINKHIEQGAITFKKGNFTIKENKWFISDTIISDLLIVK